MIFKFDTLIESEDLVKIYTEIELKVKIIQEYVESWYKYEYLWDLSIENVCSIVGTDLQKWENLINEVKSSRSTFDISETEKTFGNVVIDFEAVQFKINQKYDLWQKEVVGKYGAIVFDNMVELNQSLQKSRMSLESMTLDVFSTMDAMKLVTFVQNLKISAPKQYETLELLKTGQRLLERFRYTFGKDWIFIEQVSGEWSAFNEIFIRKQNTIKEQHGIYKSIFN